MRSGEFIRENLKIERTPRDAGWRLTIHVDYYPHNDFLSVDGAPTSAPRPTAHWIRAVSVMSETLLEFMAEVERREKDKAA